MKKNLLAIAAVLSLFATIFFFGLAATDAFITYQVQLTGVFHGYVVELKGILYEAGAAIGGGVLAFLLSLWFARQAVKHQHEDQHPKSTIRRRA